MSDLIIQKAAFRKEPGTILKSPNSNMALALKRIVEKNPLDAMNLALILQKISNKKNLQISDLKKAAKNIGKNDRDLGKTLEGISTVAENAQSDEEYAGMSIGQIVGEIVGFLKNFIGSIVKFNDIWAKAIDTTFEVNINTAIAETAKMGWEAAGVIAAGALAIAGGALTMAGGAWEGALSRDLSKATSGFETLASKFAGLLDNGGEITTTTEGIQGNTILKEEMQAQQQIETGSMGETENIGKDLTPEERRNLPDDQKKAMIENLHAERKYESDAALDNAKEDIKLAKKQKFKWAKALTVAANPTLGGAGQASNGFCQIPAAQNNMIAGKSRATGGVMESEKQRKSQLYNNTVKIFQGTSELSNTINAFIRANSPA